MIGDIIGASVIGLILLGLFAATIWLGIVLAKDKAQSILRRQPQVPAKPKSPSYNGPKHIVDNVDIGPRKLYKAHLDANAAHASYGEIPKEVSEGEANLVGSAVRNGVHMPVLDLDFPAQLIPSSTPGHFHLFLDKEVSWYDYQNLLHAMAIAGLAEDGYVRASIAHGGTFIRKPGLKKASPGDDPEFVEAQNKWKKEFGV